MAEIGAERAEFGRFETVQGSFAGPGGEDERREGLDALLADLHFGLGRIGEGVVDVVCPLDPSCARTHGPTARIDDGRDGSQSAGQTL